jgi:hypothetical protein
MSRYLDLARKALEDYRIKKLHMVMQLHETLGESLADCLATVVVPPQSITAVSGSDDQRTAAVLYAAIAPGVPRWKQALDNPDEVERV